MRVIISGATLLAWVSAVMAQTAGFDAVMTPTKDEVVAAGSTYTITWDYSSTYTGTVSIQLLEGATPTTLQLGDVIASGIDNSLGQYSWAVDSSLGDDATYGLKITYDTNSDIFQYSNPFQVSKAAAASSSAASSSVAAPATTAPATTTAVPANQDDISSTLYSTEWVTVTSCAATVTNCPARSTVTSSTLMPLITTVKPSTASSSAAVSVASSAASSSSAAPLASSSSVETAKPVQPTFAPTGPTSAADVAVPQTTMTPSYPAGNSTGSGFGAGGMGTVTLSTSTATGTGSASTSSIIAASGAGKVAAGSVALFAGLVAAMFAL